jgi:hypothetical protein
MWPSLLLNTAHGFLWHSNFLNPSPVLDVSWAGSRRLTGNIFLLHAFLFHCFSNTGCTYYWAISCVRCGVGAQCCRDYPGLQHKGLMWWVLCLHAINCVRCPVLQKLSPSPSPGVAVMGVMFACNQLSGLELVPSVAETIPVSITRSWCDGCCVCMQWTVSGTQCCRDYPPLHHQGWMWWMLCLHAVFIQKTVIYCSTDHMGNGGQSQIVMSVLPQTMQGTVCFHQNSCC